MQKNFVSTLLAIPMLMSTVSGSSPYLFNSQYPNGSQVSATRCSMTPYHPNEWDASFGTVSGKTKGLNPYCALGSTNANWQSLTAVYSSTTNGGQNFTSGQSQTVQNWAAGPAYSFPSSALAGNGWLYGAGSLTDASSNTYTPNGTLTAGANLGLAGTAGTLLFSDYGRLASQTTAGNGSTFGYNSTFSYFPFQVLSSSSITSPYTTAQTPQQTIFSTSNNPPPPVSKAQFSLPSTPASIVVVRKGNLTTAPTSSDIAAIKAAYGSANFANFIWASYNPSSKTSTLSNDATNPINVFLNSDKCWAAGTGKANNNPLAAFVLLWNNWTNAPKDWCMLYDPSNYYFSAGTPVSPSGTSLQQQLTNFTGYLQNASPAAQQSTAAQLLSWVAYPFTYLKQKIWG